MMTKLSITTVRNNLPEVVRTVQRGRPVELTRHGKPVAVLLSVADYERLAEGRTDLWSAIETFRASHDLANLDIDTIYDDVRDRSTGRDVPL